VINVVVLPYDNTRRRHDTEELDLNLHRREKLKSRMINIILE